MKEFKRSLLGYNPVKVEEYLQVLNNEFKNKLLELRTELAEETHQLQLLRLQVKTLREEINNYQSIRNEIIQFLYDTHIGSAKKVQMAMVDAEQREKKDIDNLLVRKRELGNLKMDIENMSEEITSIATQYKSNIEIVEG